MSNRDPTASNDPIGSTNVQWRIERGSWLSSRRRVVMSARVHPMRRTPIERSFTLFSSYSTC